MKFVVAWLLALAAKAWLVVALPPFGDEAFYALESTRPAWAYSDLPGLTAWLIGAGTAVGGHGIVAARLPFLLLGALLPWLVVRIARRWFGDDAGWQAGLLATLLPLAGLMGVLALPDVPMLVAALLCVDAFAAMLRRDAWPAALQLGVALALGALAHYRFALFVAAGAAGMLLAPEGRALLRSPRLWAALAIGAAGWVPLVAWNLANAGAGVGFQLVDRHPWRPHGEGAWWLPVQALAVTPVLFVALVATGVQAWRRRRESSTRAFVAGVAAIAVAGWFVLAFFADTERVSFHWPLAGWLVLCCAAPPVLAAWRPALRAAVHATAAIGLVAMFAWLAVVGQPGGRAWLAGTPLYADNFSGWDEVAGAVRARLATMPPDTRLVADNFMLGAQLALALDRDDVRVLPHPLNAKHGRAVQLAHWRLLDRGRVDWRGQPVLLVVEDTARPLKERLRGYDDLCRRGGALPPPQVLNVDHGRKRFLLFAPTAATVGCSRPALAWIDAPAPGAKAGGPLRIDGWAMKDGVGIERVDVTLDGVVVARARYGAPRPDVLDYWGRRAEGDAAAVGFTADVDLAGRPPGRAWLGLVLHGRDGSVEPWPEQPVVVETAPR